MIPPCVLEQLFLLEIMIHLALLSYFLPCDRVRPSLSLILKNCSERIRLPNCIPESGEPKRAARGFIWEAFRCHLHTDSLSNCVRQTHLTFCLSVLSRLPGGNVLMSYLPAWMMISKSQSSCCAKNNEESQEERGWGAVGDMSGPSRDFHKARGADGDLNTYCSVEFCWAAEKQLDLALNFFDANFSKRIDQIF